MEEKLGFGYLGNGITVWDSNKTENNDYKTIAHISYEREVRYYYELSHEAKVRIENFAKYGNITPTVQPEKYALRPYIGSYRLSKEEKDSFLRDHECHADGIEPFINRIWNNKDTPYENLEYFWWWWNAVQSDDVRLDETEGDTVDIHLTPEKTPVTFYRKIRCLMSSGMTEEEATKEAYQTPIQLELLYDIGIGLFGVEAEAVDSCEIYNPYSGKEIHNGCLEYPDSPSGTITPDTIQIQLNDIRAVAFNIIDSALRKQPMPYAWEHQHSEICWEDDEVGEYRTGKLKEIIRDHDDDGGIVNLYVDLNGSNTAIVMTDLLTESLVWLARSLYNLTKDITK